MMVYKIISFIHKSVRSRLIFQLISLLLLFPSVLIISQVKNYQFSQGVDSYRELTTPTLLTVTGWKDGVKRVDLPFTFNFNGKKHYDVSINFNGFLTFGSTDSNVSSSQPIASSIQYDGAVSAFSGNISGKRNVATSFVGYQTLGTAPNRIFVVQWKNAKKWNLNDSYDDDYLNFEIMLYESTMVIKTHYGFNRITKSNYEYNYTHVGLRGASNSDFAVRTTRTAWNATTAGKTNQDNILITGGITPENGLFFTWTPPLCSGKPQPGATVSNIDSNTSGTPLYLYLENETPGNNVSYQWQSSYSGTDTSFTNITSAPSAAGYTTTVSSNIYYRCLVTCGGMTTASTPVLINVALCKPRYANSCSEYYINSFSLNTLSNLNSGCSAEADNYQDYPSSNPLYTTTLKIGSAYDMNIQVVGNFSKFLGVWIDYNDNGIYEQSEYTNGLTTNGYDPRLIVPSTAKPGQHRLRVRLISANTDTIMDPCNYATSGETEDYTITLEYGDSCINFENNIAIGGRFTERGKTYPTLGSALGEMSRCGITQPTVLSIKANYESNLETFPIYLSTIGGSSAINTVTIKPAEGVVSTISAASRKPLFQFNTVENMIIDGSNTLNGTTRDLSINNTSASSEGIISMDRVENITLKNMQLKNGTRNGHGIIVGNYRTYPSKIKNVTIRNNKISKAANGIKVTGSETITDSGEGLLITENEMNASDADAIKKTGISIIEVKGNAVISNNTIGNIDNFSSNNARGIELLANTTNVSVHHNTIANIKSTDTYNSSGIYIESGVNTVNNTIYNNVVSGISSSGLTYNGATGIEILKETVNTKIFNNKISDIKNEDEYGAVGVLLASSASATNIWLYNNMIWDVAAAGNDSKIELNGHGIELYLGGDYKIYYNSVNMATLQNKGISSAFFYSDDKGFDEVKNNNFSNKRANSNNFPIYSRNPIPSSSVFNYNNYYSLGTFNLETWRAAYGKDLNSVSFNPPFVSDTDLHILAVGCNPLKSGGTPIDGITTSIDGILRSATSPDIGADEFTDIAPPKILSATGFSICGPGTGTITVEGVPGVTEYRWYTSTAPDETPIATTTIGSFTTPFLSESTTYYVAAANGTCLQTFRTAVLATVNAEIAPVHLNQIKYPNPQVTSCELNYETLEATGGTFTSFLQTATTNGSYFTAGEYPNVLSTYYTGAKHQMLYEVAELRSRGLFAGANITSVGMFVESPTNGPCIGFTIRMKNSKTSSLNKFDSDMTTVYSASTFYAQPTGWNMLNLTTPFVWDGTSNIIVEFVYNNGSQNLGDGANAKMEKHYSGSSFYAAKSGVEGGIAGFDALTSYDKSGTSNYRPFLKLGFKNKKISFFPATGLFTDRDLTVPYIENAAVEGVLYAAPETTQIYTATATSGAGCFKTAISEPIVGDKKMFTGLDATNPTLWNEANNWSFNTLPTKDKCVFIPTGKNVIVNGSNAVARTVYVEYGANLSIPANQTLTLNDGLINNNNANSSADIVIASEGNLLQINPNPNPANSGRITVEKATTGLWNSPVENFDQVYWSSPVSLQKIKGNDGFSPNAHLGYYKEYEEFSDLFIPTEDLNFLPAKGYAISAEAGNQQDKTYRFNGLLNNGNININITRSPNTVTGSPTFTKIKGFNLVGNPYPSNIDFDQLYAANSALIYKTAWFRTNNTFASNQTGAGYLSNRFAIYNGTGGNAAEDFGTKTPPNNIITVGQGFMIQKKTFGTDALSFQNSYGVDKKLRVSTSGKFMQKGATPKNRFTLQLSAPSQLVNSQLIGYVDGATNGFEQDYDAEALTLSSNMFFSTLDEKRLLIQGRSASFITQDKINLGANFFEMGAYSISLINAEGIFAATQKVYLKDKQNNTLTDLSQGSYNFTSNAGENTGRFEILYEPEAVLTTQNVVKENLQIYKDGGDFIILAQIKKISDLDVVDAVGRLIYTIKPNKLKVSIPADLLVNGIYILRINQGGTITTKKVIR